MISTTTVLNYAQGIFLNTIRRFLYPNFPRNLRAHYIRKFYVLLDIMLQYIIECRVTLFLICLDEGRVSITFGGTRVCVCFSPLLLYISARVFADTHNECAYLKCWCILHSVSDQSTEFATDINLKWLPNF
jgi:hypothetical protein